MPDLPSATPPEWLSELKGKPDQPGMLDDDSGIASIPYYRMLQKGSDPSRLEAGKVGTIWSDPHGRSLEYPITFIALAFKKRWTCFEDGQILWSTEDPHDESVVKAGEQAYRYLGLHAMILPIEENGKPLDTKPGVFIFKGRNMKRGRSFYNQLKSIGVPPYACKFQFTGSTLVGEGTFTSYLTDLKFTGYVQKDEIAKFQAILTSHSESFRASGEPVENPDDTEEAPF